jgi:hypothetical protein
VAAELQAEAALFAIGGMDCSIRRLKNVNIQRKKISKNKGGHGQSKEGCCQ